jgi:hypothetical protein
VIQGCKEDKKKGGYTRIRRGIGRRKKKVAKQKKVRFFCGKKEFANSYMMASSVFCLELGLIKG